MTYLEATRAVQRAALAHWAASVDEYASAYEIVQLWRYLQIAYAARASVDYKRHGRDLART